MIYQLARQMAKGNPRMFKAGEQKRDYIYVKDVVKANMLALDGKESCVVNCGSGTATTFNDVVAILNSVMGSPAHAGIYRQSIRGSLSEFYPMRYDARERKDRIRAGVYPGGGDKGLLRKRISYLLTPCHPLTPSCSYAPTGTGRSIATRIIILDRTRTGRNNLNSFPASWRASTLMNAIPGSKFVIVTNQSGVALEGTDFELLTEARAMEVNEHIVSALKELGCRVDGYRFCPYVTSEYAEKAALKGRHVSPRYIDDSARCLKPNIGMVEEAAAMFGVKLADLRRGFMIGDRASDIEMGVRAGFTSFFIGSSKARQDGENGKDPLDAEAISGSDRHCGRFSKRGRRNLADRCRLRKGSYLFNDGGGGMTLPIGDAKDFAPIFFYHWGFRHSRIAAVPRLLRGRWVLFFSIHGIGSGIGKNENIIYRFERRDHLGPLPLRHDGPRFSLCVLTDASEFTPTIRISPLDFASAKLRTWPMCRRSNAPFVVTTFFPARFARRAMAATSEMVFIFERWDRMNPLYSGAFPRSTLHYCRHSCKLMGCLSFEKP